MKVKHSKKVLMRPWFQLLSYFSALIALFFFADFALAATLGDVATDVTKSMGPVAQLITAASYVAGVGFALTGMMKFKAHKDNPTQVPLSQPIVLLAIAAGLIFLPALIKTTGETVFGSGAQTGGPTGEGLDIE